MARLRRTRRARQDLIEIWRAVAADDPVAADRLLDRIEAACIRIADMPRIGPARDDIRQRLRYLVVEPYLILHRLVGATVEVVRVVHGRRNLFNL